MFVEAIVSRCECWLPGGAGGGSTVGSRNVNSHDAKILDKDELNKLTSARIGGLVSYGNYYDPVSVCKTHSWLPSQVSCSDSLCAPCIDSDLCQRSGSVPHTGRVLVLDLNGSSRHPPGLTCQCQVVR